MRKAFSTQRRLDTHSRVDVPLNLECRDEIIRVLRALQHVYSQRPLRDEILRLIADDVHRDSRSDCGRDGMDYWQSVVRAAVRLGCNLTYDGLQDLAENHRRLRAIMGVGEWDEKTSFHWQRIRDNVCLLRPETIDAISHLYRCGRSRHRAGGGRNGSGRFVRDGNQNSLSDRKHVDPRRRSEDHGPLLPAGRST